MNRFSFALYSLAIACCLFASGAARAAEIKIGAAAMYDIWKPAWLAYDFGAAGNAYSKLNDHSTQGAFMVGPTLRAEIKDGWSVGLQFLFNANRNRFRYSSQAANMYWGMLPGDIYGFPYDTESIESGTIDTWKFDLDLTAGYAFSKYFNLIFGMRCSYNRSDLQSMITITTFSGLNYLFFNTVPQSGTSRASYFGPTLGLGFNTEIYNGLLVDMSVSVLLQGGDFRSEKGNFLVGFWTFQMGSRGNKCKVSSVSVGPDASVKFSYLIAPAGVELWVGGRYICLPYVDEKVRDAGANMTYRKWLVGRVEHFGGVLFGASYNFKVGR